MIKLACFDVYLFCQSFCYPGLQITADIITQE
jgi:hypothetical protein